MERKWYKYPSIKIENLPPDITESEVVQLCSSYGTVHRVRLSSRASSSSEGGGSLPRRSPGSARSFGRRSPCGADRSSGASRGDASRPFCYVEFCRDEDARMCESCLIGASLRNYRLHVKGFRGIPFVAATEHQKGYETSRESSPRRGSTPYPKGSARGKKAFHSSRGHDTVSVVEAGRGAAECDERVREGRGRKGIDFVVEPIEASVGGEQELNPEAFVFVEKPVIDVSSNGNCDPNLENTGVEELSQGVDNCHGVDESLGTTDVPHDAVQTEEDLLVEVHGDLLLEHEGRQEPGRSDRPQEPVPWEIIPKGYVSEDQADRYVHPVPTTDIFTSPIHRSLITKEDVLTGSEPVEVSAGMSTVEENLHKDLPQEPEFKNPIILSEELTSIEEFPKDEHPVVNRVQVTQEECDLQVQEVPRLDEALGNRAEAELDCKEVTFEANDKVSNSAKETTNSYDRAEVAVQEVAGYVCVEAVKAKYGPTFYDHEESFVDLFSWNDTGKPALKCLENTEDPDVSSHYNPCPPTNTIECRAEDKSSKRDSDGKCSSHSLDASPAPPPPSAVSFSATSPNPITSTVNQQSIPCSSDNVQESLPQQTTASSSGAEKVVVGKVVKKNHKKGLDTKRGGGSNASSGASVAASGTVWKCPDPHCGAKNAVDLLYCAKCKFPKRMNESSTMGSAAAKGWRQGTASQSCRYMAMGWFAHAISPIKFYGWTTTQRLDKANLAHLLQKFMDKKRQVPQQVALDEIYGLQVEDTWERVRIVSTVMEERKEEVQQEDKQEGERQEGKLEEKLWEVEEFMVTLVDNGRSVIAKKDDLALLPRSTKDFTPFLTEFTLKNVRPLRKADPDLLRQGREWLTERLGGGKKLELHCIGNPDYKDVIVQVNVGGHDISQEIIARGYGQGHSVAASKKSEDLMNKVDTLTFDPPSDDYRDGQSGGPASPESFVKDLYSSWEEPSPSEVDLLEGEELQRKEEPPSDTNLPDRSGQIATVDDRCVTESPVAYEEPTTRDGSTVSSPDIEVLPEEGGIQPQASSQPSTVHPCPSGSSPQPCKPTHQGYITTGQPCPSLPNPVGSPLHPCPPPPLPCVPTSQGNASAFQSCMSPQPQPCVSPRFQAPHSPHQLYTSPPPPLVLLLHPHPHVSPSQQLVPSSSVHSCAPRSQPCSLPSQPSGVLAQQRAQEPSQGLVQPSHPPGVSPPSETCSSQAQSTSPCQKASPKMTKTRYNFKGKKGLGRHQTHPQRPQGFTKELLFGWHKAPAATMTPVSGASGYEKQSSEAYHAVQGTGLEVSMSQIPSHKEVRLYQQNLRPELDNLEKRYSTSSSMDPEHRVLQSNPMDDREVTVQHLLGWIAAYQEEMKLMDRQGSVNKMHRVLERVMTTMKVRQRVSERFCKFKSILRGLTLCRKDELLQMAAIEDRESPLPSAGGQSCQKLPEVIDCRQLLRRANKFLESASLKLQENEGLVQVCRFLVEVHQYGPEERRWALENNIKEVDRVLPASAATTPGEKQQQQFVTEAEIFEKWKDDYLRAKKAVEVSVERLALVFTNFSIAVMGLLEGREVLPCLMVDVQADQLDQDLDVENQLAAEQETRLEVIRDAVADELREQVEVHRQLEDAYARLQAECQSLLKESKHRMYKIGLTNLPWLLDGDACDPSHEEEQSLYELVQRECRLPCMRRRIFVNQIIEEVKRVHMSGSIVGNLHPRHIKIREGTPCLVANSSAPVDHLQDKLFQPPEFSLGERYPSSDVYSLGKLIEWLSDPESSDDPEKARTNDDVLSSLLSSDPTARPTLDMIQDHVWFVAEDDSIDRAFEEPEEVPQEAVLAFGEESSEIADKQKYIEEAIMKELQDSDESTSDDGKEKIKVNETSDLTSLKEKSEKMRKTEEEGVPLPGGSRDEVEPGYETSKSRVSSLDYHEEKLAMDDPKPDNNKILQGGATFQKANELNCEDILVSEELQSAAIDCSIDLPQMDAKVQHHLSLKKGSQEDISTRALEEMIKSEIEEASRDVFTDGSVPTGVRGPASLGIDEDKGSYLMDGMGTQVVAKECDAPDEEHTEGLEVKEHNVEAEDIARHLRNFEPTVQICSDLYSNGLEPGDDAEERVASPSSSLPVADLRLATGHNSPPRSASSFLDPCRGAQVAMAMEASILAELQDTEEEEEVELRPQRNDTLPCETSRNCGGLNPGRPEGSPGIELQISDKEVDEDEIILILEDPERPLEL